MNNKMVHRIVQPEEGGMFIAFRGCKACFL